MRSLRFIFLLTLSGLSGYSEEPKDLEEFYSDVRKLSHISKIKISVFAEGSDGAQIEKAIHSKFDDARTRGLSPHHFVEIVSEITDAKSTAEYCVFASGEAGKRYLFLLLIDRSIATDIASLEFVRRGHMVPITEGSTAEQIAFTAWYWSVPLLGEVEQANAEKVQQLSRQAYLEEKRKANKAVEVTPTAVPAAASAPAEPSAGAPHH